MTSLIITNLKENETLDGAEMRDVRGGILPFIIGGGIVLGVGYAAYRFLVDDDEPASEPVPVEPASMPSPQRRSGALRDIQRRTEWNQRQLNRLGG